MESETSFRKGEAEDRKAYGEWTVEWLWPIGIFGYQNGVSQENSAKYLASVFDAFYAQLPKSGMRDAKTRLFQIASHTISAFREDSEGTLLKFQEDIEVHRLLQEMAEKRRIAFILHFLHGMKVEEAASIIGETERETRIELDESLAFIGERMGLEDERSTLKRLELAAKSYSRILFEPEEVVIEERVEPTIGTDTKRATPDKKTKILLFGASLFLAGVIGASFFIDDPNSNVAAPSAEAKEGEIVTASMIEAWKEEYGAAKDSSPERLGVEPEVFSEFAYVKEAEQQLKWTFSKNNIEKLKDDPKEMQHQVNLLLLKIETPKEMFAMLPEMYLLHEEFVPVMEDYNRKTKELMYEGNQVLKQHEKQLAEMKVNGELSPEKLIAQSEGIPEEVRNLVVSIRERGLIVTKHPADDRFILRHNMETLYSNEQVNGMMYDISPFTYEPLFDEEGLLVPVQEMANALSVLGQVLLQEEASSAQFQENAHVFQHAFWLLMQGDENQQVFDENGKVKEVYQLVWKELGQQMQNPLVYVMLPIIDEMESSGWTKSESYGRLEYESIIDALMLEKEGQLAAKLPNGDVEIENQHVIAEKFFTPDIEKLYAAFTEGYDKQLLKGVTPLDVFRVFQFANQQRDIETMWHLMDDKKPPLEEYGATWRQQPPFAKDIRWMEISKDSINRIGKLLFVYPHISYLEEESNLSYYPELVMGEKRIWEVKSHLYERYDNDAAMATFKGEVEKLYADFTAGFDNAVIAAASPGEIGGLFLLAVEKKDFEMVRALSLGELAQGSEGLEAHMAGMDIQGLSAIGAVHFFNTPSPMMEDEMSSGAFRFTADEESGEGYINQMSMVKTPEGWRMEDLGMY